jgi:hypothetical protein
MEPEKRVLLGELTFGQRVAEDEAVELARYFVETDEWRRLFSGVVDVVYGPKGSGKSALYSLLISRGMELAKRGIHTVAAENPRGATAFQELSTDPPPTEIEFVLLWKMYLLSLVADLLRREGFDDSDARYVIDALTHAGLMREERPLRSLLRAIADYVKAILRAPKEIEGGVKLDPHTNLPIGVTGKIVLREPNAVEESRGLVSISSLFDAAGRSLGAKRRVAWVLVDRLDVAFAESPELEENALRALFKAYLDLLGEEQIRLKIFLRTDIWTRITAAGFREASHITRSLTIKWDRPSLLNLMVRRALQNEALRNFYEVAGEEVIGSTEERLRFFHRMFFEQVEVGTRKSDTVDWILSRTSDGTRKTAPREVVHLLNSVRDVQLRKLELGDAAPEGERLFARTALKEALPEVSKVRLEQTIFAEYPNLKKKIETLRKEKTRHTPRSLARIWDVDEHDAVAAADELVAVGVFERQGSKEEPEFWIPFLYRDAMDVSQGTADD